MAMQDASLPASLVLFCLGMPTLSGCAPTDGDEVGASLLDPGILAAVPEESATVRPRDVVTTSLGVQVTQGSLYCNGWVNAKFNASRLSDGNWSVSADFRPRNFYICVPPPLCSELCGRRCNDVRRRAAADFTATPGVQVQIPAPGMQLTNPISGAQVDVVLLCTLTVDADGVATVQLITI